MEHAPPGKPSLAPDDQKRLDAFYAVVADEAQTFLGYPCNAVFDYSPHYSVSKILRALHVRNIMIKSAPDGRIDLDDLRETVKIHRAASDSIVAIDAEDSERARQLVKDVLIP